MKTMVVWTAKPGTLREAVSRFLAGHDRQPAGITLLNRWHSADVNIGFNLYECTDPAALYQAGAIWADLLDLKHYIVIDDAQVAPILTQTFATQEQPVAV